MSEGGVAVNLPRRTAANDWYRRDVSPKSVEQLCHSSNLQLQKSADKQWAGEGGHQERTSAAARDEAQETRPELAAARAGYTEAQYSVCAYCFFF